MQTVLVPVVTVAVVFENGEQGCEECRHFFGRDEKVGIFGLYPHACSQIDVESEFPVSVGEHKIAVVPEDVAGVAEAS